MIKIEELNELRDLGLPYITEVKEKYGTARCYWTSSTEGMRKAESTLRFLSSVTCQYCGKQPRDSKGNHIIWTTEGWITNLCKDCFKKEVLKYKSIKRLSKGELKEYVIMCRQKKSQNFV